MPVRHYCIYHQTNKKTVSSPSVDTLVNNNVLKSGSSVTITGSSGAAYYCVAKATTSSDVVFSNLACGTSGACSVSGSNNPTVSRVAPTTPTASISFSYDSAMSFMMVAACDTYNQKDDSGATLTLKTCKSFFVCSVCCCVFFLCFSVFFVLILLLRFAFGFMAFAL